MCEPVSLSIMAGLAVAGAAASAYSQIKQGQYQQAVAAENAKAGENAAASELQRGAAASGVERMKGSQQIGEARAAMGASGIDLSSGTALDVISDSRMMNELDAQTIKNNAARSAWGMKVGAVNARAQGELAGFSSKYGAATTLLGAGAQVAGMYAGQMGGRRGTGLASGGGTTSGVLI